MLIKERKAKLISKVIISADGNCDIGPELQARYNIQLLNWRIELDGKIYVDSVEIFPDDLYKAWRERKVLSKSSGATPYELKEHFKPFLDKGYEVVHIAFGSGISCAYQNCCMVAKELDGIYPVDSQNLSSAFGHLVIQAAKLAEQGLSAAEIQAHVSDMCSRSHGSFLLDTLEFMAAGGRCSNVASLGANLLQLKPCIEVDNQNGGKMSVAKKYRGNMERCLRQYVHDKLDGRDDLDLKRIFITTSGAPDSAIEAIREEIEKLQNFKEICVTYANCVISMNISRLEYHQYAT